MRSRISSNSKVGSRMTRGGDRPATIARGVFTAMLRKAISLAGMVTILLLPGEPAALAEERRVDSDLDFRLFELRTVPAADPWRPFVPALEPQPAVPARGFVERGGYGDEVHAVPIPATLWGAAGVVGMLILLRHGRRRARI